MWRWVCTYISVSAAVLAAGGMTACGGGERSAGATGVGSGEVVAQVGSTPITRAAVSHWMSTLAGGDYHQLSGKETVPAGLVSDPPNYPACVARLQGAMAHAPARAPKPDGVRLLTKCQQLYEALRQQAISLLVSDQALISLARELGVTASDAEVLKLFKRVRATEFPTEAELRQYLASRRLSMADELFLLKVNLLGQKLLAQVPKEGKQAEARLVEAERRWTARTSCSAGYVVKHCRQFTGGATTGTPPASVLIEQVATLVTGRCINLAACAKE